MEPLAFVEVVDRHGDVLARHPVFRWPARIGRGYAADVILDDPFIAPLHIGVEPAGDDHFRISDLGSVNGITLAGTERRVETAEVGPDDVARAGHTQIRIRTTSYAVPQERPLRRIALYRRVPAFALLASLTIALLLWNGWIAVSDEDERTTMLFALSGTLAVLVGWIAVWSFVGSTSVRLANFAAHGSVACAGVMAMTVSDAFFDYGSFAFDAGWLDYAAVAATAGILAYMLYRHLLLNSRARRKTLAWVSVGVSLAVCGIFAGLAVAVEFTQETAQNYNNAIKPPAFMLVSGTSSEAFMSEAEKLKLKVDAMVKTK